MVGTTTSCATACGLAGCAKCTTPIGGTSTGATDANYCIACATTHYLGTAFVAGRRNLAATAAVCTANTVTTRTNIAACSAANTCTCISGYGWVGGANNSSICVACTVANCTACDHASSVSGVCSACAAGYALNGTTSCT